MRLATKYDFQAAFADINCASRRGAVVTTDEFPDHRSARGLKNAKGKTCITSTRSKNKWKPINMNIMLQSTGRYARKSSVEIAVLRKPVHLQNGPHSKLLSKLM